MLPSRDSKREERGRGAPGLTLLSHSRNLCSGPIAIKMKKFQSYFTPSGSKEEAERENSGSSTVGKPPTSGTRSKPSASKATSTHQLQPIQARRGRDSGGSSASGPPIPPPSTVPDPNGPASARASMLSVPGVATPQQQQATSHGLHPPEALPSTTRTSPNASRAPSLHHSFLPPHDARSRDADTINEIRNDMMVNWLYEQQLRKQYASGLDPYEGVVLKKARGTFTCCPPQMAAIPDSLYAVVSQMNVRCAMTVHTPIVRALLDSIIRKTDLDYVPLPDGLRVQVLHTMADLPRGQLHHFAAFVEDVRMLVVWDDEPEKLLGRVQTLEARLIEMIWGNGEDDAGDDDDDKEKKGASAGVAVQELDPGQLEEALAKEHRPVRLESAFMVALTMALWIVCPALGWRWLAYQTVVDGTYLRFALLAACPAQLFVSLVCSSSPARAGHLLEFWPSLLTIVSVQLVLLPVHHHEPFPGLWPHLGRRQQQQVLQRPSSPSS